MRFSIPKHFFTKDLNNNKSTQSEEPKKREGMMVTLRKMGKKYILIYTLLYFGCLFVIYVMFESKAFDIDKTVEKFNKYELDKYLDLNKYKKKLGDKYANLAVAIVLNEMVEVIRFPLFLYVVIKLIKKK